MTRKYPYNLLLDLFAGAYSEMELKGKFERFLSPKNDYFSPEETSILQDYYISGKTYQEIADKTGLTYRKVNSIIRNAQGVMINNLPVILPILTGNSRIETFEELRRIKSDLEVALTELDKLKNVEVETESDFVPDDTDEIKDILLRVKAGETVKRPKDSILRQIDMNLLKEYGILSARASSTLRRGNVSDLFILQTLSKDDVHKIRNCGTTTSDEIISMASKFSINIL